MKGFPSCFLTVAVGVMFLGIPSLCHAAMGDEGQRLALPLPECARVGEKCIVGPSAVVFLRET